MSVRPEVFEEVLGKQCKCNEAAILRTTKSGPNEGRQFWTCKDRVCDFFQWHSKSVAKARKEQRLAHMAIETPPKKEEDDDVIEEEPPRKMCKIVIDDETTLTIPRDRLTKLLFD